jgi:hypothetical protein
LPAKVILEWRAASDFDGDGMDGNFQEPLPRSILTRESGGAAGEPDQFRSARCVTTGAASASAHVTSIASTMSDGFLCMDAAWHFREHKANMSVKACPTRSCLGLLLSKVPRTSDLRAHAKGANHKGIGFSQP